MLFTPKQKYAVYNIKYRGVVLICMGMLGNQGLAHSSIGSISPLQCKRCMLGVIRHQQTNHYIIPDLGMIDQLKYILMDRRRGGWNICADQSTAQKALN